jgi:GNAT superfamily N-acetyltransferase
VKPLSKTKRAASSTAEAVRVAAGGKIVVRPVTVENWKDFVSLFETKGSPHYCWCTPYRTRDARHLDDAEKKSLMKGLVGDGIPIGVVAFEGDEPIGWCSIAPRETYARLERSRTMPRVTPAATSTWSVLCFFVPRSRRKRGVTLALLEGAVAYARDHGAQIVEGYPFDTAGISSTHRGHSHAFKAAGFQQEGKRWARVIRKP